MGTAVAPGIGTIAGGVAGNKLRQTMLDRKSRKTKVFISFDFDHDRRLKDLILGQARHPDAPFKIINRSLKEAAPEPKWEAKANASIRRSDLVLVLLGERTYRAQGVLKEVKMARAAGVPIAQLIGYRHGRYTAVANAGRVYAWTRENLYKLFR
ncbi:MAG TPA: hypothetical protein VJ654_11790 [Noviherbaspirillum sp.]|nr:hypothetical protein [Noviherbaspirillum sp.]